MIEKLLRCMNEKGQRVMRRKKQNEKKKHQLPRPTKNDAL